MIPVALCADDYALAPGVDEAILALAAQGRITALSCMTASERWPQAAAALKPLFGQVEIGLHFTLTQLSPLGPMPRLAPDGRFPAMNRIYVQALLRAIDTAEVDAELRRQLAAFRDATGREPDFLDGHHHVHQLPGVREGVARQWPARPGWVRNTATTLASIRMRGVAVPRALVIAHFGRAARKTWQASGIATNADFAGVRSFAETESYQSLMRGFLKGAAPGLLVMCHPGRPDAALARIDRVLAPRAEEFAYLSGPDFPADLAAAGCRLEKLSAAPR
jgi:chitin disaccharide deacetylase